MQVDVTADRQVGGPLVIRAAGPGVQPAIPLAMTATARLKFIGSSQGEGCSEGNAARSFEVSYHMQASNAVQSLQEMWNQVQAANKPSPLSKKITILSAYIQGH